MICRIAKLREERALTQSQLAAQCGVSQQSISKLETGNGEPSYSLASSIARVLGCSIDDLYADEPPQAAV